ncbi:hypothetical protein [Paenirhodobacter sp.]
MRENPDLAPDDPGELSGQHGITVHRVSAWRALRNLGLTCKRRNGNN